MIFKSIVGKLWLTIFIFVVVILVVMSAIQNFVLKDIYYSQQSDQLIAEGQKLAKFIKTTPNSELVSARIKSMEEVLNATVVVIERSGRIIYGNGNGGMHWGMMRRQFQMPNQGAMHQRQYQVPIDQEDLQQLLEGNTVVHRGYHVMFEKDLLWVVVPVREENTTIAFVFIHTLLQPIADRIDVLSTATLHALGGVVLVTVVLSLFLSRSLSRPLLQMNQVAQSLAQGDYSRKVPVKSQDEIGLLANSLNSLSAELQEKITTLERLDQTRRDFVANVSHELRTPLTIMQGYTEAILDGFAENIAERQKYLNNILEEILRLKRLVNDVLDLRSLEAGRVVLNKQKTNIRHIAEKVVDIFQPYMQEKGVRLSFDWPEKFAFVYGDPDRLEQVMVNLIDNALRFTPAGEGITLKALHLGDEIKVSVIDSGPGIPPEELPLIWERFHKVDKARSRAGEGSGLGLAITKNIIQAHNGEIKVSSELGRGTTMEFTFPLYQENLKK